MNLLLSNEQRQQFPDRHPWSPYWSDSFISQHNPYIEIAENKENLVICYGDSWTWGDSLGKTSAALNVDDFEFRRQHVFGAKLAQKLNADFVNIAIPGIFNFWIHDHMQILIDHNIARLSDQYKKIYIIVTLTELGRDFEFEMYVKNFERFFNFSQKTHTDILINAERFDFTNLRNFNKNLPENCKLIIGRNFTTSYPENVNEFSEFKFLPKNWVSILLEKQNFTTTEIATPMLSFGIDRFNNFIKQYQLDSYEYKMWINQTIYPTSVELFNLLDQSIYNNKKTATKHPTSEGHTLWANYIYEYITNNNLI